ncbi:condensation domain-containing protein (plasmid) [Cylindrospermum sp. NIES-4074]|nr:condensation domain-containing protein [Cylindrospermum sp. NIES-4074]
MNFTSSHEIIKKQGLGSAPLSFAQERLWFLDQLNSGNHAYNIPVAIHLKGLLDVKVLDLSLSEIVQRHQALRTTFTVTDGQPLQVNTSSSNWTLPIVDLSKLSETERQQESQRLITESVQQPFDLASGPLLRATLQRLGEIEHILLLTIHEIVGDDWSVRILLQELASLYEAFFQGKPSPLVELPIEYTDFAIWQREWLQSEELESHFSYWKQQLGGELPVLELPTDHPRPPVQTYRGARQSLNLSQDLTDALKSLSQESGVTLFTTLLTAFKILLYRYTSLEDIIVGSIVANRNQAEFEGLIGLFANTLVMRTDLSGNPSFRELLDRVQEVVLSAYSHQDLPFEKLVEELQTERDLSRPPLFQVMFVLENEQETRLEFPGLSLNVVEVENKSAKFDLTVEVQETSDGINGWFEYNTDLFDADTIGRMIGYFRILLEDIIQFPHQHISNLPNFMEARLYEQNITWTKRIPVFLQKSLISPADWCISRQIESGNSIPAYLCNSCGKETVYLEVIPKQCKHCGSCDLRLETDVLDMWLSCALWCFCANQNFTEAIDVLQQIAKNTVCVTGFDLIYLWITTTALLSTQLGFLPFKDVVIHPIVCDDRGLKMSKSLGNVILPHEVISTYGADCLRLTLIEDLNIQEERIFFSKTKLIKNKNLLNQLRSVLLEIASFKNSDAVLYTSISEKSLFDVFDKFLSNYSFQEVYQAFQEYLNTTLIEQLEYLRKTKDSINASETLKNTLIVLYPIIPFLTKEIWEREFPQFPLLNNSIESNYVKNSSPFFSLLLPAPNPTGELHMGHMINLTVQDILARWQRLKGLNVLWTGAVDHGGISTQMVVEKRLNERGVSPESLSREERIKEIEVWEKEISPKIIQQMLDIGSSIDVAKPRSIGDRFHNFKISSLFKKLYDKGLIYREQTITNWCPKLRTTIGDMELDFKKEMEPIYILRFAIKGNSDHYLEITTEAPETFIGDVAIAVNPTDTRYLNYVGNEVISPFSGEPLLVIAESHVDPHFGSGVVRVTPACVSKDFLVAKRRHLPIPLVLDSQGRLVAGAYVGKTQEEARHLVLQNLSYKGDLLRTQNRESLIAYCRYTGVRVIARLSYQWFIKVEPMLQPALDFLQEGHFRIHPRKYEDAYKQWLKSIIDNVLQSQLNSPEFHLNEHTRPKLNVTFVEPRNPVEEALVKIWAEVLGLEKVGIHDNFFDLGGHSLKATQVISRVSNQLEVELPLKHFFQTPTVASLASLVIQNQEERTQQFKSTTKISRRNPKQLIAKICKMSDHEVDSLLNNLLSKDFDHES